MYWIVLIEYQAGTIDSSIHSPELHSPFLTRGRCPIWKEGEIFSRHILEWTTKRGEGRRRRGRAKSLHICHVGMYSIYIRTSSRETQKGKYWFSGRKVEKKNRNGKRQLDICLQRYMNVCLGLNIYCVVYVTYNSTNQAYLTQKRQI